MVFKQDYWANPRPLWVRLLDWGLLTALLTAIQHFLLSCAFKWNTPPTSLFFEGLFMLLFWRYRSYLRRLIDKTWLVWLIWFLFFSLPFAIAYHFGSWEIAGLYQPAG